MKSLKWLQRKYPNSFEELNEYFDRHEIDKQGSTWDEQGKGYQAWLGWGGDAGRSWANRIVASLNKEQDRSMDNEYDDESDDKEYSRYMYKKTIKL